MSGLSPNPGPRRRPRDRKQQILLAARDLFVERGYPNVSMALIAEKVGITAGGLYRHFANKTVLLEHVIEESFVWVDEPIQSQSFDDAVDEAMRSVIDYPYLSDLWIHEVRYVSEEKRVDLRRRMKAWTESLIPAVDSHRPGLDAGQRELLGVAMQSALSCLGRRAIHAPQSQRAVVVRGALHAIVNSPLVPSGEQISVAEPSLVPVSRRERLLLAASEQFGHGYGYHETSMASIGAAADVTGPSLYAYFDNKAALLRAVYERGDHALWLSLDEALQRATSVEAALQGAIVSYVRVARSWAATLEDPTAQIEFDDAALAAQREYVAELVALLVQTHPEIGAREAKLRIQVGLFLVADLYRNSHASARQGFLENLEAIVVAVIRCVTDQVDPK